MPSPETSYVRGWFLGTGNPSQDQRVPIGAVIREISKKTGVDISRIKLLTDRGPLNLKEDIDEDVSVLLLTE